jgi:hypothetical protein
MKQTEFWAKQKNAAIKGKATPYAWLVLVLVLVGRISHQMQQQGLGYIYGFSGTGIKAANPIYEI